jgi:hypothetical protein
MHSTAAASIPCSVTPNRRRATPLLLVGKLTSELMNGVQEAIRLAGLTIRHQRDTNEALALLACKPVRPKGFLICEDVSEKAQFIAWLRDKAGLFDVPVLVLVNRLAECEHAFLDAKNAGADDTVIAWDQPGITRRVLALNAYVPRQNPAANRGTAVVAHSDEQTRRHTGWILRRAGFDLAFAQTRRELAAVVRDHGSALAVVSAGLIEGDPCRQAVAELRAEMKQSELPLVVVAEDSVKAALWQCAPRTASVVGGSWDHLLFQINELTRPPAAELRATPRLFLNAFCTFRRVTEMCPTHAMTYNVSEGGLYIRTLDPPPPGSVVSVDLRLPRTGNLVVSLRARVVWVQKPIHGCAGPTPLGFGVQILPDQSPATDLELYLATCRLLCSEAAETMEACT